MLQTISITVTGKVQGVYFRQSTRKKALDLKVSGTVKNLPDGSVNIIATGTSVQLVAITEWCKQGPARAKVVSVTINELPIQVFKGFIILY
jgi:acylphosphatase